MDLGIFDHLDRREVPLDEFYESRLRLLEKYDAAGFSAYHLAEHHATPLGLAPVPGIFLAAATQRTRRIRLGPCVYCLPLYDPLRLIEEVCMLDQLSRGRFDLGVGRAKRTHSSTRRAPMPSPRALGSTSSRRSWATAVDCLTRNTDPTISPSFSAIQARSRFGS